LERDLYLAIGNTPISLVTPQAVLKVLRKIEQRGSIETAKRVKGYIVSIFRRAKAEQLVSSEMVLSINDIGDAVKLAPIGSKQPTLTNVSDLIELQWAVESSTSDVRVKLASRPLALTAVR
jgi:hypothetical protein